MLLLFVCYLKSVVAICGLLSSTHFRYFVYNASCTAQEGNSYHVSQNIEKKWIPWSNPCTHFIYTRSKEESCFGKKIKRKPGPKKSRVEDFDKVKMSDLVVYFPNAFSFSLKVCSNVILYICFTVGGEMTFPVKFNRPLSH